MLKKVNVLFLNIQLKTNVRNQHAEVFFKKCITFLNFSNKLKQRCFAMRNKDTIKNIIEGIVDKQLMHCTPPEAYQAYIRLTGDDDFTDEEARQLLSRAIQVELFRLVHFAEPFNKQRYIYNLAQLPDLPAID